MMSMNQLDVGNEMLTIAQIAAEIGVSKQAIHKKIKQEPLSTSLRKLTSTRGNAVVVSVDGAKLIKQAFADTNTSTSSIKSTTKLVDEVVEIDNQNVNQLTNILQAQVEILTEQNKDLREQLNEEREHSRVQADQIIELAQNLAQLAQNAQKLHAGDIVIPHLSNGEEDASKEKLGIIKRLFGKKKRDRADA